MLLVVVGFVVPAGALRADNVRVTDAVLVNGTLGTLNLAMAVGETTTVYYYVSIGDEGDGTLECNIEDGSAANFTLVLSGGGVVSVDAEGGGTDAFSIPDTGDPASGNCATGDGTGGTRRAVSITATGPGVVDINDVVCDAGSFNAGAAPEGTTCFSNVDNGGSGSIDAYIHHPVVTITVTQPVGQISGLKYYDSNTNGQFDLGEAPLANWPITVSQGGVPVQSLSTDGAGQFNVTLNAGTYDIAEVQAAAPWLQTGNTVNQASDLGGNLTTLSNFVYTVIVTGDGQTTDLNFGNVCAVSPGGRTPGFWSNKNGKALFEADLANNLALLVGLNLRNPDGTNFDPVSYAQFRTWLLDGNAVNMAYMLSVQLAATALNVKYGFTDPNAIVDGATTVQDVIDDANTLLGLDGSTPAGDEPNRSDQEALKDILDAINNGDPFAQPDPADCPPFDHE